MHHTSHNGHEADADVQKLTQTPTQAKVLDKPLSDRFKTIYTGGTQFEIQKLTENKAYDRLWSKTD